jgi:hypothetical protein
MDGLIKSAWWCRPGCRLSYDRSTALPMAHRRSPALGQSLPASWPPYRRNSRFGHHLAFPGLPALLALLLLTGCGASQRGYPALATVPDTVPQGGTVEQRRAIVEGLMADRIGARQTSDMIRARAGVSPAPQPTLPAGESAAEIVADPEVAAPSAAPATSDRGLRYPRAGSVDDGSLGDFIRDLERNTAPDQDVPTPLEAEEEAEVLGALARPLELPRWKVVAGFAPHRAPAFAEPRLIRLAANGDSWCQSWWAWPFSAIIGCEAEDEAPDATPLPPPTHQPPEGGVPSEPPDIDSRLTDGPVPVPVLKDIQNWLSQPSEREDGPPRELAYAELDEEPDPALPPPRPSVEPQVVEIEHDGHTYTFVRRPTPIFKPDPPDCFPENHPDCRQAFLALDGEPRWRDVRRPGPVAPRFANLAEPRQPRTRVIPPPLPAFRPALPPRSSGGSAGTSDRVEAVPPAAGEAEKVPAREVAAASPAAASPEPAPPSAVAEAGSVDRALTELRAVRRQRALELAGLDAAIAAPQAAPWIEADTRPVLAREMIAFPPGESTLPAAVQPMLATMIAAARQSDARIYLIGEASEEQLAVDRVLAVGLALTRLGATAELIEYEIAEKPVAERVSLLLKPPAVP